MVANNSELEKRLWAAADQLRANSRLKATEYSVPVLGMIFLRYADVRFARAKAEIGSGSRCAAGGRGDQLPRQRGGVPARGSPLRAPAQPARKQQHRQGHQRCHAAIEEQNPDLKDVLPKTYNRLENSVLVELLKLFNSIPMDMEGDAFGKIYEYFLGNFAHDRRPARG